jgi:hypothetical protein
MRHSRFAFVIATLAFVASACGSGASTSASGATGAAPTGLTPAGSTVPGSTAPAVIAPSFAAAGSGSCGVQIDGDVTKSWHTDQTTATLLVSDWLSAADKAMLAVKDGDAELLINCQSDQGSISLTTTAGTTSAQLPESPATYVIEAGGLVADRKPGEIQTVINLKDTNLWRVTEPGTFDITSFNPSHLAGSFSFKIGRSDVGSQTVLATATISGTFDLSCTGSACK